MNGAMEICGEAHPTKGVVKEGVRMCEAVKRLESVEEEDEALLERAGSMRLSFSDDMPRASTAPEVGWEGIQDLSLYDYGDFSFEGVSLKAEEEGRGRGRQGNQNFMGVAQKNGLVEGRGTPRTYFSGPHERLSKPSGLGDVDDETTEEEEEVELGSGMEWETRQVVPHSALYFTNDGEEVAGEEKSPLEGEGLEGRTVLPSRPTTADQYEDNIQRRKFLNSRPKRWWEAMGGSTGASSPSNGRRRHSASSPSNGEKRGGVGFTKTDGFFLKPRASTSSFDVRGELVVTSRGPFGRRSKPQESKGGSDAGVKRERNRKGPLIRQLSLSNVKLSTESSVGSESSNRQLETIRPTVSEPLGTENDGVVGTVTSPKQLNFRRGKFFGPRRAKADKASGTRKLMTSVAVPPNSETPAVSAQVLPQVLETPGPSRIELSPNSKAIVSSTLPSSLSSPLSGSSPTPAAGGLDFLRAKNGQRRFLHDGDIYQLPSVVKVLPRWRSLPSPSTDSNETLSTNRGASSEGRIVVSACAVFLALLSLLLGRISAIVILLAIGLLFSRFSKSLRLDEVEEEVGGEGGQEEELSLEDKEKERKRKAELEKKMWQKERQRKQIAEILQHSHSTDPKTLSVLAGLLSRTKREDAEFDRPGMLRQEKNVLKISG